MSPARIAGIGGDREAELGRDGEAEPVRAACGRGAPSAPAARGQRAVGEDRQAAQPVQLAVEGDAGDVVVGAGSGGAARPPAARLRFKTGVVVLSSGSAGTSRWCGWRRPGRGRGSRPPQAGQGRPGGVVDGVGVAAAGDRGQHLLAGGGEDGASSSSLRSASGRQGSRRAAKQASLLKMLPMPATRGWSSRASPRVRVGSARIAAITRVGVEVGGEDVGAEAGQLRVAAQARRWAQAQGRAAELDRFLPLAGQHRPGGAARLAPAGAAAVDVPGAVHPHVAVQDEVAEVRAAGACRARRPLSARGRRGARSRAARPRGLGALAATVSPTSGPAGAPRAGSCRPLPSPHDDRPR